VLFSIQVESYGLREVCEAFIILRSTGKEMSRKQESAAPKSCQECEHWAEVRNKLRVGEVLQVVIKKMEENLVTTDFKASLGDYLKLVQMEKEVGGTDEPKEITVTWVQPDEPSTGA
jgi:hypothetical protein